VPRESTTRHTWTAGVHPGTPGPGKNSLMVHLDVGGVVVVAAGRSDVPLQSMKREGKNKGGPTPPAAGCCPIHTLSATGGVQASRWWR
jgi:hypothetical protein